tara:strand:+ start:4168 stop:4740 length:573 start_codon:yes stop_codon:yes gene_type:complete
MKTLTLSFTFFLFLIIFTSCKKEEKANVELPPTSQNGSFTLGCLVNNVPWIPRHYSNSLINPPGVLSSDFFEKDGTKTFNIHATHWREFESSDTEVLSIYVENSFHFDTVVLDSFRYSGTYLNYIIEPPDDRLEDFKSFQSIGNVNSWLIFSKFDTINRIASGKFSADMVNVNDSLDSLKIRQGTFDVRF